jgi:hypothetical protein
MKYIFRIQSQSFWTVDQNTSRTIRSQIVFYQNPKFEESTQ